jgi:DNA invertase Pin-like site-specific DNA recombinase
MIYGYIRVSTDKQTTENQRFELLKYADEKHLHIDRWIEETVSATRRLTDRKLGRLIEEMHTGDTLLVSELSRLGRSLMEVMSILHNLMEKNVKVYTAKERDCPEIWGIMTIGIGPVEYVAGWGSADGMDAAFGWDGD